MRFTSLLGLLLLSAIPRGESRATYQLHTRASSDVCADVDAALIVKFLGTDVDVGPLNICLCLSGIPALLTSNIIVKTAVGLVGGSVVSAALTSMVNSAADHQTCLYPDNADPICDKGTPCGFNCKNGFEPSPLPPKDCVCLSPKKVCNGICGAFGACPSSGSKKRNLDLLQRRAICDGGFTACGVYGFNSADAWECIDTRSDLESCGGCMVPFGRTPAHGVDCTAIPGVMDVSCVTGSCVVRRCQPGYVVSLDGSFCLHTATAAMIQNTDDIPAALYGLEHVPLKKKED
ncbi:hypothetical protein PHLGIDRAFT_99111 [Phlebiopsis gigantea 11061_1 CR5-6]|uniref:Protein CPL1-like domain-containing protein n=1 Tax=Phlebiopsis gigantea (strain 11061_1 CR5-6) TaxID=745531 RepID=A0A0C3S676_PHLG1|nr:hypothetical protein PHLGIDRAFT_99111 [Phlebiopsis gigantea 11061_1 CR5-6]